MFDMRRREFITLLGGAAVSKGMEKTMMRFTLLLLVALLGGTDRLSAQETVETRGITSEVKIDEVIFGHLTELNGKFKLRATELTFAPDGYVGVHHHIGPGIRYGHLEKFFSPSRCESDSLTAMDHGRMERASHGADGLFRC
jgi:hypothetical protein